MRWMGRAGYSDARTSTGSSFDARAAGLSPKNTPTNAEKKNDSKHADHFTANDQSII